MYIHRSGRTGRAGEEGVSLSLVSPTDMSTFKHLSYSLQRKKWINFPIEPGYIERIAGLMWKAKQLDQLLNQQKKKQSKINNDKKIGADQFVDDDLADENEEVYYKRMDSELDFKRRVSQLESELAVLLQQPLIPKGTFFIFIYFYLFFIFFIFYFFI